MVNISEKYEEEMVTKRNSKITITKNDPKEKKKDTSLDKESDVASKSEEEESENSEEVNSYMILINAFNNLKLLISIQFKGSCAKENKRSPTRQS